MATRRPTQNPKTRQPAAPDDLGEAEAADVGAPEAGLRQIEDAIDPVARAMGFEVVQLEWAGGRGSRILRVFLDHPRGVSLDDCTRMSGVLSNALDAAEADPATPELAALLSAPYTLEVSSPGVDRPLVKLSHFAAQVGNRAVVRTRHPLQGQGAADQKTFHGRLVGTEVDAAAATDDRRGIVLLQALDSDIIFRISLADIRRANLVYFPPEAKKGHEG